MACQLPKITHRGASVARWSRKKATSAEAGVDPETTRWRVSAVTRLISRKWRLVPGKPPKQTLTSSRRDMQLHQVREQRSHLPGEMIALAHVALAFGGDGRALGGAIEIVRDQVEALVVRPVPDEVAAVLEHG